MRWGTASIVAFVFMLGGGAIATAAREPGDPPTVDFFKRCNRDTRPCSDPLILASGDSFAGNVEVIGFNSQVGFCIEEDTINGKSASGVAACGGPAPPRDGKPATVRVYGGGRSGDGSTTELLGTTASEVAGVRLRYPRNGETTYEQPIFAHVDGDLATRVGVDQEFGAFYVTVHGCIRPNRMRIVAFDSAGAILGHTTFPDVGDVCRAPAPTGREPASEAFYSRDSLRLFHPGR